MKTNDYKEVKPFNETIEELLWSGSLTEEEAFNLTTPHSFSEFN